MLLGLVARSVEYFHFMKTLKGGDVCLNVRRFAKKIEYMTEQAKVIFGQIRRVQSLIECICW